MRCAPCAPLVIGDGNLEVTVGALRATAVVRVVDPASKLVSLKMAEVTVAGSGPVRDELALSKTGSHVFALVGENAARLPIYVGKRAITTPCFLAFKGYATDGPAFNLSACAEGTATFEAEVGGAKLALPVRIRVNETSR